MNLRKILTVAIVTSFAITGLFATTQNNNYIVNADAASIPYTLKWYSTAVDEETSATTFNELTDNDAIVPKDNIKFDLLDTSKQESYPVVLKTASAGNLKSSLTMSVDIVPTSFYEIDSDGNAISNGFNTGSTTTEFGYSFAGDNKLLPVITMNKLTNGDALSNTYGVIYNQDPAPNTTNGESLTIGAGYHDSGLILSSFTLAVTGNKNVKAGTYKSDIAINVTYN